MIHITDSQTDRILDVIDEDEFWEDKHYKSLKDTLETFDFVTFANKRYSEHLSKRNRIVIPDEDGKYIEFVIENTQEFRDSNGGLFVKVYTSATYITLTKAKVIKPQILSNQTVSTAVSHAIGGTEWEAGTIANVGTRTFVIEEHTNPYLFLKRIASELDLELHFRVETDGNRVTRRYVDLVERVGMWRGREVEFGKDLIGIERKEDFSNIVTALIGLGPEREDGTRLEVFVEDKDALARWGRNGQHLIDVYEPESTDQTMTEARLRELTQNELEKRINSIVEYTADIADLEKVPGLEHEKIRFGDTIRIKDTQFNPPLYLEARVHTQERSIKKNGYKTVTLGDYIEYTEEQVFAIWKSLKAEIAKKVSLTEVKEVVYTKPEVDSKDAGVYQDSTYYADNVSETKKQEAIQVAAEDATEKANQAKQEAVEQAESIAEQKKQLAIQQAIADAETKINAAKSELEADIALKADAEWVNGQLVLKADNSTVQDLQNEVSNKADVTWVNNQLVLKENAIHRGTTAPTDTTKLWLDTSVVPNVLKRYDSATSSWVKATPTSAGEVGAYTKTEVDNALNSKVSVTTYTADKNGIISRLDSAESRITQNEQEIATKVSQTDYDALEGRVSQAESSIIQNANAIQSKVSQTDFNALEGRVSTAESTITQHANLIEQKVNQTDYDTDMNGVITRLDSAESRITQTENEIATKVSKTEFESGISEAITNGVLYCRGTGLNRNGNRILRLNGNTIYNQLGGRGLRLTVIRRSDLAITHDQVYDVYGSADARNQLANYLNGLDDSVIVVLTSYDAIATDDNLDTALKRCGGTGKRFGGRVPYALVGIPGIGEGAGIEVYTSTDANAPMAEINTRIIDGIPQGFNTIGQSIISRVTNAETSITQNANQIALKANKTDVYTKTEIDGQFSTVNQQISQLDAELSIQAGQIATKVSRTEFENLQIGGRNLIKNSGNYKTLGNWTANGSGTSITLTQKDGFSVLEGIKSITGENVYGIKNNTEYVFSAEVMFDRDVNITSNTPLHCHVAISGDVHGGKESVSLISKDTVVKANTWSVISVKIKTRSNVTITHFKPFIYGLADGTKFWVKWWKLEEGNKPTAWTPAPEDVQGQIDGLGTRVSSAETSITQLSNQIQLKANQTTVDTLANRISSAESTLTIHTNQIASKVSQTDFNGNTIASLINQTATTIKLLAERIEFAGHVFGEDATFSGNIEVRKTVDNQVFDNMFNGDEFRFVKFKKGITNPNTKNIDLSQVENMAKIFYDGVAFANSSQSMGLGLSGITHSGLLNVYANRIAMSAVSAVDITSPVSIWGNTDVWGSLTADKLKANVDIEFGANGRLTNEGANVTYIQGNGEVRATKYKSGTLVPMYAASFNTSSSVDTKTNIEKWEESALEILRNEAELYSYNKIDELNDGINRKRHGFVIGGEYKVPAQLLSLDGKAIDGYEHSVLNTKAIMELDDEQQRLRDEIEWLKIENQYFKQKIAQLEAKIV